MKFSPADADVLTRILTWRHDVRRFRDQPVGESLIDAIAATMNLAPSVGNARPWRVLRIEDQSVRTAVRNHFAQCNEDAAQAYAGGSREAYGQMVLAGFDTAPIQLAVFTVTDPVEGRGLGRRTMPETLGQSTAMAIHTLWLAARAHNLGLGMVSILQPSQVERICAVPPEWRFCAWLCLGYPETDENTPLLHRNGWQFNTDLIWEKR